MRQRRLGKSNISVSAIGFGCMGLSEFYAPVPARQQRECVERALFCGITHFDTADMYGRGANEELLGDVLRGCRRMVTIATKCGIVRRGDGARERNGSAEHVRRACDASLRRLRTDYLDVLYLHRVDPQVPIEESVGAMAELAAQGMTRAIGLSKLDAATLGRAERVHPVAAVQAEYSLGARQAECELLGACEERDIALVAYSPLCKGLLGDWSSTARFADTEYRSADPRIGGAGLSASAELRATLAEHARANGCTPAQLALAWLLSRGTQVIPLPGMRSPRHVVENALASELVLPSATRDALDRAVVL